jgi:hypothetical protein
VSVLLSSISRPTLQCFLFSISKSLHRLARNPSFSCLYSVMKKRVLQRSEFRNAEICQIVEQAQLLLGGLRTRDRNHHLACVLLSFFQSTLFFPALFGPHADALGVGRVLLLGEAPLARSPYRYRLLCSCPGRPLLSVSCSPSSPVCLYR